MDELLEFSASILLSEVDGNIAFNSSVAVEATLWTSPECEDDPDFNEGYGGCATYAPGGDNAGKCAEDGATVM